MLTLQTPPASNAEPVTLDEAKLAARISGTTAHDAMVPGYITAARQLAEHRANCDLAVKVWRWQGADWPAADDVIAVRPASAVAASYWDGTAWQPLDTADLAWLATPAGVSVAPALALGTWPTLGAVAIGPRVRIDITAGLAPSAVPEVVKMYIKSHVAAWVDNPSALADGAVTESPWLRHLLDGVVVYG